MTRRSSFEGRRGRPTVAVVALWSLAAITAPRAIGQDAPTDPDQHAKPDAVEQPLTTEEIARRARASLVLVTVEGRDGVGGGIGTGFVVGEEGLIATNLHVIGEGRRFSIESSSGQKLEVRSVHASDRLLDLALVKVDTGGQRLPALELGDSDALSDGSPIVALGNPHGLKYSVVSGVVSGSRDIDGRKMLQLAIPIEPGNSGGPVLDARGRVLGVVTMKSALTENLGFAVAVNQLKPLLLGPNPVPLSRWLTIGQVDPRRWQSLFGARWQQRGGRIVVQEAGDGFGGRALCLRREPPPPVPFEIAAEVRLDDPSGAAGLVFHADGGDKHYGFYPSNGNLRLSCFEGPSVFSWRVIKEVTSDAYRPGQWNHLKVRVEKDKLSCFVNDRLVIESDDATYATGQVGLAKFRDTEAEFKAFRVADRLPPSQLPDELAASIDRRIDGLDDLENVESGRIEELARTPEASRRIIDRRARELEKRTALLRRLADDVHVASVIEGLRKILAAGDDIDLLRAALLLARLDERDLEVDAYVTQVDDIADEVKDELEPDADSDARIRALNRYLFEANGFHGNRFDYYHRTNSYLNRVIDDRTGLPITLSVLYMELAGRLGVTTEGVGLPGHFVVRFLPDQGEPRLVDVFDRGRPLSREEAEKMIVAGTGRNEIDEQFLDAVSKREILLRMLRNLRAIAQRERDQESLRRYLEAAVEIDPQNAPNRGMRAVARFQTGRRAGAVTDLDWILERRPEGIDLDRVREMREYFLREK